jgi:hypothetical protein
VSRSKPHENAPNPAVRWFEWKSNKGLIQYYDKQAERNVEMGDDFTFLLLDELATIKGWHDASSSGIYANEVRDTRKTPFVVKAFKAPGPLAEGLYQSIRDRVQAVGGRFHSNLYIAFKNGGDGLAIGSLQFRGAALGAWFEFRKAHRNELNSKAVRIHGHTEGKKGGVTFKTPIFKLADISPESNRQAIALDVELQKYLDSYLARNTHEQIETPPPDVDEPPPPDDADYRTAGADDDPIPF